MSKVNHSLYHSRGNLAGTQGRLLCRQRITDTHGRHSRVDSLHPTRIPQILLLIYHPELSPPEGHIPPGFL